MERRPRSDLLDHLDRRLASFELRDEALCVAFSGGRDSVALLSALHMLQPRWGYRLSAVHVNHRLSPNADHWQAFCEAFCEARAIPLHIRYLHLQRGGGESLEALARAGRYDAFGEAPARFVALAHHAEDQAETFLLQAIRGAGPAGLASMPAAREWRGKWLLRPLLGLSRRHLEAWLREQKLDWIEDESNGDVAYRRNAIRHRILPELEGLHAGSAGALARAARLCGEAHELLRELARIDGDPEEATLPVAKLAELSPIRAKNLLRFWLSERDPQAPSLVRLDDFLDQLFSAAPDRQPELKLERGTARRFAGRLWWDTGWRPQISRLVWSGESELRLPSWQGYFSFEKAVVGIDPLRLRRVTLDVMPRRGGEVVRLAGTRPRQSLKNLFQAIGIPPWERQRWPLLYADGQLIAVPGIGLDPEWQTTPGLAIIWHPD